jgi:hypothetical protein
LDGALAHAPRHDLGYWRAIHDARFQVPEGESAYALALDLDAYLGSPDPDRRDATAYEILSAWIRSHAFDSAEMHRLVERWGANLEWRIGESGTPSVFTRSFSALVLSEMARAEARAPFLDDAAFRRLVERAIAYMHDERDLRGFDASLGWIHGVAHGADLLRWLAASRRLSSDDGARILDAVLDRTRSAEIVFTFGEDERLADVLLALTQRPDFDERAFIVRLTDIQQRAGAAWADGRFHPSAFVANENHKRVLEGLFMALAPQQERRAALLDALRDCATHL